MCVYLSLIIHHQHEFQDDSKSRPPIKTSLKELLRNGDESKEPGQVLPGDELLSLLFTVGAEEDRNLYTNSAHITVAKATMEGTWYQGVYCIHRSE